MVDEMKKYFECTYDYDRKVLLKYKEKFYSTVIKLAILYKTKCWQKKKTHTQENKFVVVEMRMLGYMSGITRLKV